MNIVSYLKYCCVEYLLAIDGGVGIGMEGGEGDHPVYSCQHTVAGLDGRAIHLQGDATSRTHLGKKNYKLKIVRK